VGFACRAGLSFESGDLHILFLYGILQGLLLVFEGLLFLFFLYELVAGIRPFFSHLLRLLFIPILPVFEQLVGLHKFFQRFAHFAQLALLFGQFLPRLALDLT
jgi:hypothetical protein